MRWLLAMFFAGLMGCGYDPSQSYQSKIDKLDRLVANTQAGFDIKQESRRGAFESDPDGVSDWLLSLTGVTGKNATPIAKNEPTPFTGQLLTNEMAIDLGLQIERYIAELRLQKKYCEDKEEILRDAIDRP